MNTSEVDELPIDGNKDEDTSDSIMNQLNNDYEYGEDIACDYCAVLENDNTLSTKEDEDIDNETEEESSIIPQHVGSNESSEDFTVHSLPNPSAPAATLGAQDTLAYNPNRDTESTHGLESDTDFDVEGRVNRWFSTSSWYSGTSSHSNSDDTNASDMQFKLSLGLAEEDCIAQREALHEIVSDSARTMDVELQESEERRSIVNYKPVKERNTVTTRQSLLRGTMDEDEDGDADGFGIADLKDIKLTDAELKAVTENNINNDGSIGSEPASEQGRDLSSSSFAAHHSTSLSDSLISLSDLSRTVHQPWCPLHDTEAAAPVSTPAHAVGYGYIPTVSADDHPGIVLLQEELVSCAVELEHIPGQVNGVGQAQRNVYFAFRLPVFPSMKAKEHPILTCSCHTPKPPTTTEGDVTFQCPLSPTVTGTMCYTSSLISLVDWYSVFPERNYCRRDGSGGFHASLPVHYDRCSSLEQIRMELNFCYKEILLMAYRNQRVQTVLLALLMAPLDAQVAKPPGWMIRSFMKSLPTHVVTTIMPNSARVNTVITHTLDFSPKKNPYTGNYSSLASSHLRKAIRPPPTPGVHCTATNTMSNLEANRVVSSPYIYESPCITQVCATFYSEEYLLCTLTEVIFMKPKDSCSHKVVKYKHHSNEFTVAADAHIHAGDPQAVTKSSSSSSSVGSDSRGSGSSKNSTGQAQPEYSRGASTSTIYRVALDDILEVVSLGGGVRGGDSGSKAVQNSRIGSLNVFHILYHFNIVTLAKVYHVAVRGKAIRDHWVNSLGLLCRKREATRKAETYTQRLAALSAVGPGSGGGAQAGAGGGHSINDYHTREQMVAIPFGWFRYCRSNASLYSENVTLLRPGAGKSTVTGVAVAHMRGPDGINVNKACPTLLMWTDASAADSTASSKRIILNHRSCYTGVNYSPPLLLKGGNGHKNMTGDSAVATPEGVSVSAGVARRSVGSLVQYVEAILQLLFDILETTRSAAAADLRRRQIDRDIIDTGNAYITPGLGSSDSDVPADTGRLQAAANVENAYQIYFNNRPDSNPTSSASDGPNPNPDSEPTASSITYEKPLSTVDRMWVIFLDAVASLQNIDLLANVAQDSLEMVCIWVNLFHIMQMHSVLVLGSPRGTLAWMSQFRTVSYEAFGDVFSLCEMEHNIIAAGHSRPKLGPVADLFLIPRLKYSFALNTNDVRLHFILNRGAGDQLKAVPIYRPNMLALQCDVTIATSLPLQVSITSSENCSSSSSSYNAGAEFMKPSDVVDPNPYTPYMDEDGSMINNNPLSAGSFATGSPKKKAGGGRLARLSSIFGAMSGSSETAVYTITLPWCTQWHPADFMEPMGLPEADVHPSVANAVQNQNRKNAHVSRSSSVSNLLMEQKGLLDPHLHMRCFVILSQYVITNHGENFSGIKDRRTRRILGILLHLLPYTHGYMEETFTAIIQQGHVRNVTIRYTKRSFEKELFYQMVEQHHLEG